MIEHGSIEVIADDGTNYGVPITPLFPLNITQAVSQVKNRTGVTLGNVLTGPPSGYDTVPTGLEKRWAGTSTGGQPVEVRVWKTAG